MHPDTNLPVGQGEISGEQPVKIREQQPNSTLVTKQTFLGFVTSPLDLCSSLQTASGDSTMVQAIDVTSRDWGMRRY